MVIGLTLAALCQVGAAQASLEVEREPPALWRESEHAAAAGLEWLASKQTERGYWQADVGHKRMDNYMILRSGQFNEAIGEGHIGVTALCGIAFLAGGHMPDRGEYGLVVRKALDYVIDHVQENGYITDGGTRMYSHAFATMFLAQVYGTSGGDRVREHLERSVQIIVDCQNRQGGWRYNAFTHEADVSVTVCQVQSLRAARNIGIRVPRKTIEDAVAFIKRARTPSGSSKGLFYYKNEGASARTKNREYAINAAAVTALFSAGVTDEALWGPALDFVERSYGEMHDYYSSHYYYWYGNYYACQAFFQAGGPRFDSWQDRICRDLVRAQRRDGRWVNDVGPGDAFSTAVACMVLQIRKQFLPIFQR